MLAGAALCLGLAADPQGGPTLYYVGPFVGMLATFFFGPGLIGGLGVLARQAWARVLIGLLSVLLLLAIPIGTVLGVFGLWALSTAKAQPKPPGPAPSPAPGPGSAPAGDRVALLMTMAAVAAGFVVLIGLGFRLHGQTAPVPLDQAFYPALVLLLLAAVVLARRRRGRGGAGPARLLNPITLHRRRQALRREQEAFRAGERLRIAELSADPRRRKYVALMEGGQPWSDAQIAYDLDFDRTVTCIHLQSIERAMRDRGLQVRFLMNASVSTDCRVDEAGLTGAFQLAHCLGYVEFFQADRAAEDFPTAQILCGDCRSVIQVLHPSQARPQTPWFPSPPA